MGNTVRDRRNCYGYIKDSKKRGCMLLDTATSEKDCASCSFYCTQKEYYDNQRKTEQFFYDRGLRVTTKTKPNGENYVTVVDDDI